MTAPRVVADDAAGRAEAIEVLGAGGIVALPTDTVYGIAVALSTPGGIERLFHVKQRPPDKAMALLVADVRQAATLAVISPMAAALADAFWPGPLTLVLTKLPAAVLPDSIGAGPTVGLRLPDHPSPRALAAALGPLPTTSANRSGQPDLLDAGSVVHELGTGVELVLDGGRTPGSRPSTVVDLTVDPPALLRIGAIDEARIRSVLASARDTGSSGQPALSGPN